ncbi:MAG: TonB-dependent receptor plug domain-containing protein [Bacteroidota bacterium]
MYLIRRLILSLMIGGCLLTSLFSQEIQGIIKSSETEEVLAGCLIRSLINPEKGAYSDEKGQFSLPYQEMDTLKVSRYGYEAITIVLTEEWLTKQVIYLSPRKRTLETVQIEAFSSIAEDFAIYQLNKLDVYLNPAAKADPLLAVNALPSATTLDESASISLRGNSPSATGIFLNQIPMYDAGRFTQLNGIGTFSIFQTELLEKIEVYPGNPPLEYGNSTSGVVALQLPDQVNQNSHSLSVSLANLGILSANKFSPKVSLTAYGNYQPHQGLTWLNEKSLSDIQTFQSLDAGAYLSVKASPTTQINFFNYGLKESYTFNFQHPSYQGDFIQDRFRNSHLLNVRVKKNLTSFSFLAAYSRIERTFDVGNISLDETQEDIYMAGNLHKVGKKLNVKAGIILEPRLGSQAGSVPAVGYALAPDHPKSQLQTEESFIQLEGFTYLKWKVEEKLSIGAGGRVHQSLDTSRLHLSRQLHVVYKFSPQHRIHLSGGTYFQRVWEPGRFPRVLDLQSDQLSLDYFYSKKKFTMQASVYHTTTDETSVESTNSRTFSGLEAYVEYNMPYKFTASLTYNSIMIHKTTADTKPYDIGYWLRGRITYSPVSRLNGSLIFIWREGSESSLVTQASLDQELNVFRPERYVADRLPTYFRADANVSYVLGMKNDARIILFASASNIFNRRNAIDFRYQPNYLQDGFSTFSGSVFYAGLMINWQ